MRERSRSKRELLNGTRYTSLVIVAPVWHEQRGSWVAKCLCDCGKEVTVRYDELESGGTKSCGCYSRFVPTHGGTYSEEYKIWANMIYRCRTSTASNFQNYGGRGISVCERWVNSFEHFLADVGERPNKAATIDRINVNGDYEPTNCKWATPHEQAANRRNTCFVTYEGKEIALPVLCRMKNVDLELVRSRLKRGWVIDRAITPVNTKQVI